MLVIMIQAAAASGCAVFEQDTHFVEVIRSKRELIHVRGPFRILDWYWCAVTI